MAISRFVERIKRLTNEWGLKDRLSQTRTTLIFAAIFLSVISLIDVAYSQDDTSYTTKLDEIDNLLPISLPIGLIGVSLTGAAFLLTMLSKTEDSEKKAHMQLAKKNFVRGFLAFLICLMVVFIFDFVEIINEHLYIQVKILDIIGSYGLFGIGLAYLVKAAKQIYITV